MICLSGGPRKGNLTCLSGPWKPISVSAHVKKSVVRHRRRKPKPASTSPTTPSRRRAAAAAAEEAAAAAAAARPWRRRRPRRPSARCRRISRCRPTPSARSRKARALWPLPRRRLRTLSIYLTCLLWLPLLLPTADIAKNHQVRKQYTIQVGENELVLKARTAPRAASSPLNNSQGFADFFAVSALLDSWLCLLACRSWSCSAMGLTCTSSSDRCWSSRTSRRPRLTLRSALSTSRQSCESFSADLLCGSVH